MSVDQGGDKAVSFRSKFRNDEATVTILKGAPVFFSMNGTRDGFDCKSAESLADVVNTNFAGIALQEAAPGKIRESMVHGLCTFARVVVASRSAGATNGIWVSYSAGAIGDVLTLVTATGSVQAISRSGPGLVGVLNQFALAQTYASATTSASSLGPAGSIYSISEMKVFIRSM